MLPGVEHQVLSKDQPPSRLQGRDEPVRLEKQASKVNDGVHTAVVGETLVRNKRRYLHDLAVLCVALQRPARVCKHRDEAGIEAVEN